MWYIIFMEREAVREKGLEQKEVIKSPRKLISFWRSSAQYQEAFEVFYTGKKLAPDVTEEEKRQVFEEGTIAGQTLISFVRYNTGGFSYQPEEYSSTTQKAINGYVKAAKFLLDQQKHGGRDELMMADKHRALFHNKLADSFIKDGLVETRKIGRALGRLILIDLGMDNFSSAGRSDEERAKVLARQNSGY